MFEHDTFEHPGVQSLSRLAAMVSALSNASLSLRDHTRITTQGRVWAPHTKLAAVFAALLALQISVAAAASPEAFQHVTSKSNGATQARPNQHLTNRARQQDGRDSFSHSSSLLKRNLEETSTVSLIAKGAS